MQVKCSKDTLLSREKNSQYSNYIPILIKLDTNLKGVTKCFGNLKCLWNCKNIVMSIIYFFSLPRAHLLSICTFIYRISNIFIMCFMMLTPYSPCNFSLMDTTNISLCSLFYLTKPLFLLVLPTVYGQLQDHG